MQVILLQRVPKLGQMGDIVDVRNGYARNFLLPQSRALRATKANIAAFESHKAQLEAQNLETRNEAQAVADKLDGETFVVIRSASDTGALYGSVTNRDVAGIAGAAGFTLDRSQVVLDRPIKELGLHPVTITLHPEVEVKVTVNVARSEEEAELQAAGKSIRDLASEEDAEAIAEFEIEALFEEGHEQDAPDITIIPESEFDGPSDPA